MNSSEVKAVAKKMGLNASPKMPMKDLIRAVQEKEGNFPCFGTAQGFCDQTNCSWKSICLGK